MIFLAKYQLSYTGAQILAMLESIAGKAESTALTTETTARQTADSTLQTSLAAEVTARQAACSLLAPLASPALTGTPTAPTAATATSSTQIASTAFVKAAIAASGFSQIATGTYTGTGVYGSSSKNSLTLAFAPKLILLSKASENSYLFVDPRCGLCYPNANTAYSTYASVSGYTVSWYHTYSISAQMNVSGATYYYMAIG